MGRSLSPEHCSVFSVTIFQLSQSAFCSFNKQASRSEGKTRLISVFSALLDLITRAVVEVLTADGSREGKLH
jgi:chromatin segregation and condensation protein Rec8/ScpA/Scc1 (kleisin family)